jgi:hypothetical protein
MRTMPSLSFEPVNAIVYLKSQLNLCFIPLTNSSVSYSSVYYNLSATFFCVECHILYTGPSPLELIPCSMHPFICGLFCLFIFSLFMLSLCKRCNLRYRNKSILFYSILFNQHHFFNLMAWTL